MEQKSTFFASVMLEEGCFQIAHIMVVLRLFICFWHTRALFPTLPLFKFVSRNATSIVLKMRRARRFALGGVGYAQRLKMFDGLCSTIVQFS